VSPNKPRPKGDDGARNALLGYLFQFVATAAQISVDEPADGESWAVVEEYGQDAATGTPTTVRLIQSKYSEVDSKIGPQELSEILVGFERSDRLARHPGTTTRWVLLTNRELSREADRLYRLGQTPPGGGGVSQEHIDTILRLREHLDYEHVTLEQATEDLEARARQFGETDTRRVADRVFTLLRKITLQPQGTRRLWKEDLDEAIADRPNPQVLFGADSYKRRSEELAEHAQDQRGVRIEDAVPRQAIERVFGMDDHALVVVTGPGGSGKTLSLLKATHGLVTRGRPAVRGAGAWAGPGEADDRQDDRWLAWGVRRHARIHCRGAGTDSGRESRPRRVHPCARSRRYR
jgi:hypothetical protein